MLYESNGTTNDRIVVSGTVTLPTQLTVTVSNIGATVDPLRRVLFTAPAFAGNTNNFSQWTLSDPRLGQVSLVGTNLVVTPDYDGLMLILR